MLNPDLETTGDVPIAADGAVVASVGADVLFAVFSAGGIATNAEEVLGTIKELVETEIELEELGDELVLASCEGTATLVMLK